MPEPFREVSLQREDEKAALIFFDFNCQVCAGYHEGLMAWAASLPHPWRASFVPVAVPTKESVISSRAFFAAAKANPAKIGAFMSSVYRRVHAGGMKVTDRTTWKAAAADVGIRDFDAAVAGTSKHQLEAAMAKLLAYRVNSTPTLAIGGRFIITPDNTNGDSNLFFQLANGMVSKSMGRAS